MSTSSIRLFGCAVAVAIGSQKPALSVDDKTAPKWEYRVVPKEQVVELGKNDFAAGLNKLGEEGWELVVVDGGYIFKRPRSQNDREIAELKLRIAILNRDIELQKERLSWSNRMVKMGYLSNQALVAEQERQERFELVRDKLNKDLERLIAPPAEPIPLAPQPKERKVEK